MAPFIPAAASKHLRGAPPNGMPPALTDAAALRPHSSFLAKTQGPASACEQQQTAQHSMGFEGLKAGSSDTISYFST